MEDRQWGSGLGSSVEATWEPNIPLPRKQNQVSMTRSDVEYAVKTTMIVWWRARLDARMKLACSVPIIRQTTSLYRMISCFIEEK
jgi:hypothetical protein